MVVDKLIDRKVVVLTAQQATPLLLTGSSLRAIVCPTRQSIRSNKISGIMGCYRNGHCLRIFSHKYISTWCLKIYLFSTDFWKTAGFRCLIIIDLYFKFRVLSELCLIRSKNFIYFNSRWIHYWTRKKSSKTETTSFQQWHIRFIIQIFLP